VTQSASKAIEFCKITQNKGYFKYSVQGHLKSPSVWQSVCVLVRLCVNPSMWVWQSVRVTFDIESYFRISIHTHVWETATASPYLPDRGVGSIFVARSKLKTKIDGSAQNSTHVGYTVELTDAFSRLCVSVWSVWWRRRSVSDTVCDGGISLATFVLSTKRSFTHSPILPCRC